MLLMYKNLCYRILDSIRSKIFCGKICGGEEELDQRGNWCRGYWPGQTGLTIKGQC